jgi:hypothetical protein
LSLRRRRPLLHFGGDDGGDVVGGASRRLKLPLHFGGGGDGDVVVGARRRLSLPLQERPQCAKGLLLLGFLFGLILALLLVLLLGLLLGLLLELLLGRQRNSSIRNQRCSQRLLWVARGLRIYQFGHGTRWPCRLPLPDTDSCIPQWTASRVFAQNQERQHFDLHHLIDTLCSHQARRNHRPY